MVVNPRHPDLPDPGMVLPPAPEPVRLGRRKRAALARIVEVEDEMEVVVQPEVQPEPEVQVQPEAEVQGELQVDEQPPVHTAPEGEFEAQAEAEAEAAVVLEVLAQIDVPYFPTPATPDPIETQPADIEVFRTRAESSPLEMLSVEVLDPTQRQQTYQSPLLLLPIRSPLLSTNLQEAILHSESNISNI